MKVIQAILTSDTMEKASEQAGVSRGTLYRWLKEDLFKNELKKARQQLVEQSGLKLQRAMGQAIKTLLEICKDKDATAGARVSAARSILENAFKVADSEELEEKVRRLEEMVKRLSHRMF